MNFAEQYYIHYPQVAIGHWPPFFYLCAGIWGLILGVGHASYLMFMALIVAVLAALLRVVLSHELGVWWSGLAGLLLLLLPPIRETSELMMLDTMVALMSLLAGCALVYLFSNPTLISAILFGLFTSCAILTKGTGMALVMAPLVMIVLTRNVNIIRTKVFWLPALIVAAVAGPWTILFMSSAKQGWEYHVGWKYTLAAIKGFCFLLVDAIGPVLFIAAAYGIWVGIFRRRTIVWSMLFALLISTYMFIIIVPSSIGQRYLTAAFPPLVGFAMAGIASVAKSLQKAKWSNIAQIGVVGMIVAGGVMVMRKPRPIAPTGFNMVAEYVIDKYSNYPKVAILVCSDGIGEGAMISGLAAREPKPGSYFVLRGSKQLARSLWSGQNYHVTFSDEESVKKYLESLPVTIIITDQNVGAKPLKHVEQVESVMTSGKSMWHLDSTWNLPERKIKLYSINQNNYQPPTNISVDMESMLGRNLKAQ